MRAWEREYGNGLRDALRDVMARARVPRWRASDHAPGTVADLLRSYRATREIVVWAGASERTVWLAPEGNHAFRAWHDYCHIRSLLGFDAESEVALGHWQAGADGGVSDALADIVLAEIADQASYFKRTGRFLDGDQLAFAHAAVARRGAMRRPYNVRGE